MLLLDTSVLIWWLTDDKRLGRRAGGRIDKAWPDSLSMCAASVDVGAETYCTV